METIVSTDGRQRRHSHAIIRPQFFFTVEQKEELVINAYDKIKHATFI
jgi:hypothetical protein